MLYAELIEETKKLEWNVEDLIENAFGTVSNYVAHQYKDYTRYWQLARIREMVATYKASLALPKLPESMARYQSSLDNDLYKAMRALKDAQSWRVDRRLAEASGVVSES